MRTVGIQFTPLAGFVTSRLNPAKLRFIATAVILVSLALLVVSFATTTDNRTANGLGLGSDYLAFYNAGTILNQHGGDRLYDLSLQSQLYHQNLPGETPDASLPFANGPHVAVLMRPLALLPYAWSYATWIGISVLMFGAAFALIWKHAQLPKKYFTVALLLALSFEPFIIECLHGGQISTIGLLAICAAIHFSLTSRPFRAGCVLALCTYKPTLLVIILPMLLMTRQYKTLAGFAFGALTIAVLSIATVGTTACMDYLHMLAGYAGKTSTGTNGFQVHKFIDLNSFLKLLGATAPMIGLVLLCCIALVARCTHIARPTSGKEVWALALTLTPVLNLYVGIYDAVLLIPAVMLSMRLMNPRSLLLVGLWVTPWFSGLVAQQTGVQLFTIAIAMFAVRQLLQLTQQRRTAASAIDKISFATGRTAIA